MDRGHNRTRRRLRSDDVRLVEGQRQFDAHLEVDGIVQIQRDMTAALQPLRANEIPHDTASVRDDGAQVRGSSAAAHNGQRDGLDLRQTNGGCHSHTLWRFLSIGQHQKQAVQVGHYDHA